MVTGLHPLINGGAGGEAPLPGSGVSPETFSLLRSPPQEASYEWISVTGL